MTSRTERANAIRILAIDAIYKAQSGHPGTPMGMADISEVLWRDVMRYNPANPRWYNRDRFVYSNGHGSMLLYALLHLTGYDLTIEDIRRFRQLHSRTPGHPEYGYAPGIETTTGPLGQGIANAVGMALAEKTLAAQFNRPGLPIVDHHTYAYVGEGCLMEGISHEACALAGTLGLGKLITIYDRNMVTNDGPIDGVYTDDTRKRFEAYDWQVIGEIDGHDPDAVLAALTAARAETNRPSLIICRTTIGQGCSEGYAGTHKVHGGVLPAEEIAKIRERLHWPHPPFDIPAAIYADWDRRACGADAENAWNALFERYRDAYPDLAAAFERRMNAELPEHWHGQSRDHVCALQAKPADIPSRKASQNAIETFAPLLPEMFGGCADITPSCLTRWSGSSSVCFDPAGNYVDYGVREFGMVAMANGIALHGGLLPYTATFLMFMEYARNAVRMAALMKQRQILVYTHDSIGLGEDGPTHQPVEQLASLRQTPNMVTWRPCDQVETAIAWISAIERRDGPTAFSLSRLPLRQHPRDDTQLRNAFRGGYVLSDSTTPPDLILIATGSEVTLALEAARVLRTVPLAVRVVSMPSPETFDAQDEAYRESVLPDGVRARLAIEAASTFYWSRYVGLDGGVVGMTGFGESGPAEDLFRHFGFTIENVVEQAHRVIARVRQKR
ncbi:transketolase [Swaminathania salitolerans]|uniref:Transketolase n=1 Tax=Swaminathania salitolerans TaxID=182838 RepID=A0A511BWW5_9PROT|nr:transketolase [Swaminathania salitolerans]GEL02498.1 transketolase [Swaminathania salitolerans]